MRGFKKCFYLLSLRDEASSLSARVISDCQTTKLNEFCASELLEKARKKKIELSSDEPGQGSLESCQGLISHFSRINIIVYVVQAVA